MNDHEQEDSSRRRSEHRNATRAAADWLARRDRGLTAAEQDDYLQWLGADPQHARLMAEQEATLRRMQALAAWQPQQSCDPNPDLFAPKRRQSRTWFVVVGLAAAAVLAVALGWRTWRATSSAAPVVAAAGNFLRVNERQALEDGSVVELKDGSRIEVRYTAAERRIRLTGEAHFTVAKNPGRPFLVEAGRVTVRAVGTAFNVRLDSASVDVVVTEGQVRVEPEPPAVPPPGSEPAREVRVVSAQQRTVVPLQVPAVEPEVVELTAAELKEVLAWQAPRLQFFETPLAKAIAEFNRHNPQKVVLGDPALAGVRIGGTFRVDNVEGFVRLLEVTLAVRSEPRGAGEFVLFPAR